METLGIFSPGCMSRYNNLLLLLLVISDFFFLVFQTLSLHLVTVVQDHHRMCFCLT